MPEKYTIEYIRSKLLDRGYRLLDDVYLDVKSKLNVEDADGYKYHIEMSNFLSGREPERFRKTNPYSIYNLNIFLLTNGSKSVVVSEKYENAHSKLSVRCGRCGGIYKTCSNHIVSRGQIYCPSCSLIEKGLRHRVPIETVKMELAKSKLTPLFADDEYEGDSKKLPCLDSNGKKVMVTYRAIKQYNKNGSAPYSSSMSKIECLTKEYLDDLGLQYKTQATFPGCAYKSALLFDFKVILNNGLFFLIEADGEQHTKYCEYYYGAEESGMKKYLEAKKRDEIKNKFCAENNITLLRIPYKKFQSSEYKMMIDEVVYNLQNIAV